MARVTIKVTGRPGSAIELLRRMRANLVEAMEAGYVIEITADGYLSPEERRALAIPGTVVHAKPEVVRTLTDTSGGFPAFEDTVR
jgi:hypothetical protein